MRLLYFIYGTQRLVERFLQLCSSERAWLRAPCAHLKKLPSNLLIRVKNNYWRRSSLDPPILSLKRMEVHGAFTQWWAFGKVPCRDGEFILFLVVTRVFDEQHCAVSCGCLVYKRWNSLFIGAKCQRTLQLQVKTPTLWRCSCLHSKTTLDAHTNIRNLAFE